jgi:hypothetical protein
MTKKNNYAAPKFEAMVCMIEKGFAVSDPTGAGFEDYKEEDLNW